MRKDFFSEVQKVVEKIRETGVRSRPLMEQIRLTALYALTGEVQHDCPVPELHKPLLALLKKDPGRKIRVLGSCGHWTQVTTTEALAGGAYLQLDTKSLGMYSGPIDMYRDCSHCLERKEQNRQWESRFSR